jgi:hypothetical protein
LVWGGDQQIVSRAIFFRIPHLKKGLLENFQLKRTYFEKKFWFHRSMTPKMTQRIFFLQKSQIIFKSRLLKSYFNSSVWVLKASKRKLVNGKKFLLRHFFGQVLSRKNSSFIRASLLSEECFISPRFCLLEFKITSNLEKYFCGFIHV